MAEHAPPQSELPCRLQLSGMALLAALPWLMPLASGPSPMVMPWLFGLACLAGLLLCSPLGRPAFGVWALLGGLALAAWWRGPGLPTVNLWTGVALGTGMLGAALGAHAVREPALAEAVASGWLGAALFSCGIALCQHFGLAEYFSPWMNPLPADSAAAYANLRQRNLFASLTSLGLLCLLWGLARGRWRTVAPGLLVLLALGNASSLSRTGFVQWFAIAAVALLFWRRLPPAVRHGALWALPAYVLAAWALSRWGGVGQSVWLRWGSPTTPLCADRAHLWSNVLDLIAQKPWLGWGWRELSWALVMNDFPDRFCDLADHAHSLPLHLAVELGIPLALVFCAGLAGLMLAPRPWAERQPARLWAWGVLALLLLHSAVEYPLWYLPFLLAFGLALGLLWPARVATPVPVPVPVHRRARLLSASLGLVLALAVAYAAWDYRRISPVFAEPAERDPALATPWDALGPARPSVLFAGPVRFAELLLTPLTPDNAASMQALALQVLHYSPEPRVLERLIESSRLLGDAAGADFYARRYERAFPAEFARWRASGP